MCFANDSGYVADSVIICLFAGSVENIQLQQQSCVLLLIFKVYISFQEQQQASEAWMRK